MTGPNHIDGDRRAVERDKFFADDAATTRGLFAGLRMRWVVAVASTVFIGCALTLSAVEMLRVANCLLLGMSTSVLTAYTPGLWREGVTYSGRLLILGICCTWASAFVRRIVDIAWWDRISMPAYGATTEFTLTFVAQLVLFVATLAGAFHLAAPNAIRGQIPDRNWVFIGSALGLAAFIWAFTKTA